MPTSEILKEANLTIKDYRIMRGVYSVAGYAAGALVGGAAGIAVWNPIDMGLFGGLGGVFGMNYLLDKVYESDRSE